MVRATPVESQEAKELFWIGSPPVSWEVAQAVRPLLQPDTALEAAVEQGLFPAPEPCCDANSNALSGR